MRGMGFAAGFAIGLKALVALFEATCSSTMPIEWRHLVIYGAFVLLLAFLPGGFFRYGALGARRV